jgi:hypothetical protein
VHPPVSSRVGRPQAGAELISKDRRAVIPGSRSFRLKVESKPGAIARLIRNRALDVVRVGLEERADLGMAHPCAHGRGSSGVCLDARRPACTGGVIGSSQQVRSQRRADWPNGPCRLVQGGAGQESAPRTSESKRAASPLRSWMFRGPKYRRIPVAVADCPARRAGTPRAPGSAGETAACRAARAA